MPRELREPAGQIGAWLLDTLAATDDLRTMAGRIPGARFRQLNGTHFLPLQYPDQLHDELRAVAARTDLSTPTELDPHEHEHEHAINGRVRPATQPH